MAGAKVSEKKIAKRQAGIRLLDQPLASFLDVGL